MFESALDLTSCMRTTCFHSSLLLLQHRFSELMGAYCSLVLMCPSKYIQKLCIKVKRNNLSVISDYALIDA